MRASPVYICHFITTGPFMKLTGLATFVFIMMTYTKKAGIYTETRQCSVFRVSLKSNPSAMCYVMLWVSKGQFWGLTDWQCYHYDRNEFLPLLLLICNRYEWYPETMNESKHEDKSLWCFMDAGGYLLNHGGRRVPHICVSKLINKLILYLVLIMACL